MSTAAAPVRAAQARLGGGGQDRSVGGRETFDSDARAGAGEGACASDAVTAASV